MKLYGRNPVFERLRSNPRSIKKIYIQERHNDTSFIKKKAKKWGIPVLFVPKSKLTKMARNLNTQGLLAQIEDFEYISYEELLVLSKKKKLSLLFLDGLTDPQNLGGIIRSAACFGHFAVILPTHDSVGITETVLRVCSGADNYIKVAQVANINKAIVKAKAENFSIVGAVLEEGEDLNKVKLPLHVGLVIGSEQKGIRDVVRKHLDLKIKIPMAQQGLSLNVAHATAVFCYEITKQKK